MYPTGIFKCKVCGERAKFVDGEKVKVIVQGRKIPGHDGVKFMESDSIGDLMNKSVDEQRRAYQDAKDKILGTRKSLELDELRKDSKTSAKMCANSKSKITKVIKEDGWTSDIIHLSKGNNKINGVQMCSKCTPDVLRKMTEGKKRFQEEMI